MTRRHFTIGEKKSVCLSVCGPFSKILSQCYRHSRADTQLLVLYYRFNLFNEILETFKSKCVQDSFLELTGLNAFSYLTSATLE